MTAHRCSWHENHVQCTATEDLVSWQSPTDVAPRLLCETHLRAAHAGATRRRFQNDERPRVHSAGTAAAGL